ncbi:MAG: hypothetical protein IJN92_09405 [Lachnospiraceae bacterium]|nr:hypothetical protein [Lachnospiraceae bacterium]
MNNKKAIRQKKPTREQKKIIVAAGLDWHTWNVTGEDNISLDLISKKSNRRRSVLK